MPILPINGLQMHVETYGEAGEPILLLHGALATVMQNWRMILQPLSQRFRVIAIDQRGHGETDNPSGRFTLEDLRDDALAVLDAFELPNAHVLGCSLGGYVAMALRAAHPARVGSLALAGVQIGWEHDRPVSFTDYAEASFQAHPLWGINTAKAHATHYGPEHWRTLVAQVDTVLATFPDRSEIGWDALRAEAETRGLFYVVGDRDERVPLSDVVEVRRARPDAEIMVMPRAGHLFREYNPQVFVAAYTDFLRRHRLALRSVPV